MNAGLTNLFKEVQRQIVDIEGYMLSITNIELNNIKYKLSNLYN